MTLARLHAQIDAAQNGCRAVALDDAAKLERGRHRVALRTRASTMLSTTPTMMHGTAISQSRKPGVPA